MGYEYAADGTRTDISTTQIENSACFTNSLVRHDFLGRPVLSATPTSSVRTTYVGSGPRVSSETDDVSGIVSTYLYNSLHEVEETASGGLSEWTYSEYALTSGAWWRTTESYRFDTATALLLDSYSAVSEQLTGLSNALRSRIVRETDGVVETSVSSFANGVLTEISQSDVHDPVIRRSMRGRVFETDDGETRSFLARDPMGRVYLTMRKTVADGDLRAVSRSFWTPAGDLDAELFFDDGFCRPAQWNLHENALHALHGEYWPGYNPENPAADVAWAESQIASGAVSTNAPLRVALCETDAFGRRTRSEDFSLRRIHLLGSGIFGDWTVSRAAVSAVATSLSNAVETAYYSGGHDVLSDGDGTLPTLRHTDALGRLASLSTSRDGLAWDTTSFSHDPATGLLTAKTYADDTTVAHTYTADGLPLRTTWARGVWRQNSYDANRRLSAVSYSDGTPGYAIQRDTLGRVVEVEEDSGRVHEYAYDDETALLLSESVTDTNGVSSVLSRRWDGFRREVVRDPAFPDRILACTNYFGTTAVTGFEYQYDLLGRPVRRNGDAFAYDTRGQVVGMVRPLNANHSETNSYAYDLAGNRTHADDHASGIHVWTANGLNQCLSGPDLYQYDADGNLVWIADPAGLSGNANLWDANNRMVACTNETLDIRYAYDWRDRRTMRSFTWQGTQWNRSFPVYDGWNIVHERREYWAGGWVRDSDIDFFWGPDLSGTLQGAGGVGGLVAVSIVGQYYFPCYDNLGNVVAYMDEGGTKVASYTYDAFGFTLSASGSMRDTFPHRFSTKWQDNQTLLYDYGYRWYWPDIGRWMNRDPIGEKGGENLYAFCGNTAISAIDKQGLRWTIIRDPTQNWATAEPTWTPVEGPTFSE